MRQQFREVAVTLTVEQFPRDEALYFFALQASFATGPTIFGSAHLGLQTRAWKREKWLRTANWGGYDYATGSVLDGTRSLLPPRPDVPQDPNTRHLLWYPGVPYRLHIAPAAEPGYWSGTIMNLRTEESFHVRDLHGGGETLMAPMVWSEVFADCSAPSVRVRWSDFEVVSAETGELLAPEALKVNYQSYDKGGCTNTNSFLENGRAVQATNTRRKTPQGTLLKLL
jgi:hypothetical protein